jgi:hypothetical protein
VPTWVKCTTLQDDHVLVNLNCDGFKRLLTLIET